MNPLFQMTPTNPIEEEIKAQAQGGTQNLLPQPPQSFLADILQYTPPQPPSVPMSPLMEPPQPQTSGQLPPWITGSLPSEAKKLSLASVLPGGRKAPKTTGLYPEYNAPATEKFLQHYECMMGNKEACAEGDRRANLLERFFWRYSPKGKEYWMMKDPGFQMQMAGLRDTLMMRKSEAKASQAASALRFSITRTAAQLMKAGKEDDALAYLAGWAPAVGGSLATLKDIAVEHRKLKDGVPKYQIDMENLYKLRYQGNLDKQEFPHKYWKENLSEFLVPRKAGVRYASLMVKKAEGTITPDEEKEYMKLGTAISYLADMVVRGTFSEKKMKTLAALFSDDDVRKNLPKEAVDELMHDVREWFQRMKQVEKAMNPPPEVPKPPEPDKGKNKHKKPPILPAGNRHPTLSDFLAGAKGATVGTLGETWGLLTSVLPRQSVFLRSVIGTLPTSTEGIRQIYGDDVASVFERRYGGNIRNMTEDELYNAIMDSVNIAHAPNFWEWWGSEGSNSNRPVLGPTNPSPLGFYKHTAGGH